MAPSPPGAATSAARPWAEAAAWAPASAPWPAPAAPAKRGLVVDNDGAVSAAPEPKRQACGDEKDPIVLE